MGIFLIAVILGAGLGFTVGMIAGGRIAGGKVVKVEAPYAYVEGGTPGCAGAIKQLAIAAAGTVIGGICGAVGGLILEAIL
jgi:hypothetical protein